MVVFACNSCGASLKKNQVDKHVYQCRSSSVSCMDCQKDFGIKDYGAHNKCISEVEKYGGENWKAPSNFNKGEKKQQAWVDTVNATLKMAGSKLNPPSRNLLQTLTKHDNVPRKKAKFMNFLKNICKNRFDTGTVENVWNLLEEQWKAQAEANKKSADTNGANGSDASGENKNGHADQEEGASKAGGESQGKTRKKDKKRKRLDSEEGGDDSSSKKKGKKRKVEDEESVAANEENEGENGHDQSLPTEDSEKSFRWGSIIRELLLKQPDHELSMKKLRKKVLAEYYGVVGDSKGEKTKEELISKLNKKLKKQQFKIVKDNVKLIE